MAAALYGTADFFGGMAARRISMLTVTAGSQAAGLICLLALLPFFDPRAAPAAIAWSLAGGVCGGIGIALLYHALSVGKMGVVSPITAVLAASLPIVAGVLRGDALAWFQYAGIGVALVAVVLISMSKEESGTREIATSGVKEAIASGIAIGLFFLALGIARHGFGLGTLLYARVGSVAFLLLLAGATRARLRPPAKMLPVVLGTGVVDMAANVLYVLAAQTGELAIAAVLSSLYPGSTVLLARVVLKERLATIQKFGVVLALVGVGLIAA